MSQTCEPEYPKFFAEGIGQYDTRVVVQAVDEAIVEGMLPDELELAPQSVTGDGKHPLMMLFGRQSGVRPDFMPEAVGMNYDEFIVVLPFVQWRAECKKKYRGPFAFMPRLYLDELFPTLLGWWYAYPKELARMSSGDHYSVDSLVFDRPILRGAFVPYGPTQSPDDFPNFERLRPIFEIPLVGKLDLNPSPYRCSHMTFELERATAQACEATVDIMSPFLPGLVPGVYRTAGLDVEPLGAFLLDVPWRLTLPFNCGCIDCA